MSQRGIALLVLIACLTVVGCSSSEPGDDDGTVGATVPSEEESDDPEAEEDLGEAPDPDEEPQPEEEPDPEPEPEPKPEDPYAIPDEIDAEYLDRVFEALNEVALEIRREVVERQQYTDEADDLLSTIYTGYALGDERAAYRRRLEDEFSAFAGGPLITTAERIADRNENCLAVFSIQHREELLVDAPAPTETYSMLLRHEDNASTSEANPTGWQLGARLRADEFDESTEEGMCDRFEDELEELEESDS